MGLNNKGLSVANHGGIQQIRPWHRALARATAAGMRPNEICAAYGYTPAWVTRIMSTPLFQAEVARIESLAEIEAIDVREDLNRMAPRAVEVMDECLDQTEDRKLQFDAAKDVLDRTGHARNNSPALHLHKHEHVEVSKLTDEELYRDVIEMAQEENE